MGALSLFHVFSGLIAVCAGLAIFALRKGDRRHRLLGFVYVACMLASLIAIIARGVRAPHPFHGYAVIVALALIAAVVTSRFRIRGWRAWHAALMSFSLLGAMIAVGGVLGGVILGMASGPAYYRMFNVVIIVFTLAGLGIINTRSVIWGRGTITPQHTTVRRQFTASVLLSSALLVITQWIVFR